jgi:Ca2+-binding RTX toxin-like protein
MGLFDFFRRKNRRRPEPQRRRSFRLHVERLEDRNLLAADLFSTSLSNGVLTVTGTAAADTINVWRDATHVHVDGVQATFAVASVTRIAVNSLDGNDRINLNLPGKPPLNINAVLNGGVGNDTLIGGRGSVGNDTLIGGAGNDTYVFDTYVVLGTDTLDESGGGTDTLSFSGTTTRLVAVNLALSGTQVVNSNLSLRLSSSLTFENVIGGALADTLTGNSLNNRLEGRAGNDVLAGGSGNDTYAFDADTALGNDRLSDSFGTDRLDFAQTDFQSIVIDLGITGQQSVNANLWLSLEPASAFENVTGGFQSDLIRGNSLANDLRGGAGADIILGGPGNDSLRGGSGRDVIVGGTGADTLLGEADDDLLIAGTTTHDGNNTSLTTIRNVWAGTGTYDQRTASLRAGVGRVRLVGLLAGPARTVFDDGTIDSLTGGLGQDWFFAKITPPSGSLADDRLDAVAGETVERL